jgi:hypothetical protein
MQPNRRSRSAAMRSPATAKWMAGACLAALAAGVAARPAAPAKAHTIIRPGHYGQVQVRGEPPPLIYPVPVVAQQPAGPATHPVYLYVPPGQVRHWSQNCAKWNACERPVYFVRVDDSPSRMGSWKKTQRPKAELPVLQALLAP